MIHRNLVALHRPAMARGALGMGLVLDVLLCVWTLLVPERLPWMLISVISAVFGGFLVQHVTLADPRVVTRSAYPTRTIGAVAIVTLVSFAATALLVVLTFHVLVQLGLQEA